MKFYRLYRYKTQIKWFLIISIILTLLILNYIYHYRLYGILVNFSRLHLDPNCKSYQTISKPCNNIKIYVLGEGRSHSMRKELEKFQPELYWKPTLINDTKMNIITKEYKLLIRYILSKHNDCFITLEDDIYNVDMELFKKELEIVKKERYLGYSFFNNGIEDNKVFMWGLQAFLWTPELAQKFLKASFTGHIDKYLSETNLLCKTALPIVDHSFKNSL